jgi:hypothetical protein
MQNRSFFEKAVLAAKKSKEAFEAEFKQPEANANSLKDGDYGDPLIHTLICKLPDENLPDILKILIEHKVDLESDSWLVKQTPLAIASDYCKKLTVAFLLENKANVNDCKNPPLNCVIHAHDPLGNKWDIINMLIEHGANVNIQDEYGGTSPLMQAVEERDSKFISLLLSKKADLSLKETISATGEIRTVLSKAYYHSINSRSVFGDKDQYAIKAKECFDMLLYHAAKKYFEQNPSGLDDMPAIKKYVNELAGNFKDKVYASSNSERLMMELEKAIKHAPFSTFLMGSRLTAQQKEAKVTTPVFCFFNKNDGRNLAPLIYSYVYGSPKQKVEVSEVKSIKP